MSGNLRDFLVELASNPDLMTEFASDPARVLDRIGLTPDERAALLGRDSNRLRSALGAGAADHMTQIGGMKKKGGGSKKR